MDSPVFDLNLFDFENYIPEWGNVSDQELVGHVERFEEKEKKNSRFAALNDSELQEIVADAEAKGTKRNTKWVVKTFEGKYKNTAKHTYFLKYYNTFNCVHIQKLYSTFTLLFLLFLFTDWCRNRRVATPLLQMSNAEGCEYSRSSLLGFRNAIRGILQRTIDN